MTTNQIIAIELLKLAKLLRASPKTMPKNCFLHGSGYTKLHKSGRSRWKDRDGFFYEWDAESEHVEKYGRNGKFFGAVDPLDGHAINTSKDKPGRHINVH